jgi:hypothetical protein
MKTARMLPWLGRMLKRNPEGLLALLLEAHRIDKERADISQAFRAGVEVGRRMERSKDAAS